MENNEKEINAEDMILGNQKTGGIGPVVGSIIILLVILIGGYYFWNKVQEKRIAPTQEQELNTSDEVSDIEADLETTTDFEDIEGELDAIDKEFAI